MSFSHKYMSSPHKTELAGFFNDYVNRKMKLLTDLADITPSQLYADLFVIDHCKYKKDGYFVEFGAANGHHNSNTWLLETQFGWKGILSEPARVHHADLFANRRCNITTECVWTESGQVLDFRELQNAEMSVIEEFATRGKLTEPDFYHSQVYQVRTIGFTDLLDKYSAPNHIDYLSIDTEGTELEILQSLDWNRYSFEFITCEHNHTEQRKPTQDFLASKGYRWVNETFADFDDWFIKI